jgi:hypothetical protein
LLPEHNAASNRLRPGILQQAPHGCFVLDATLEPDLTVERAPHEARLARNFRAVDSLIRDGVVECAYAFQQVRLPVSGTVTVLSTGTGACAAHFADSCQLSLTLQPGMGGKAGMPASADAPVQGMRAFLASAWQKWDNLSYAGDSVCGSTVPNWVSQRLVQGAKALAAGMGTAPVDTGRAFDTVTTLLRALTVSHGSAVVDDTSWRALEVLTARVRERNLPELQAPIATVPAAEIVGDPAACAGGVPLGAADAVCQDTGEGSAAVTSIPRQGQSSAPQAGEMGHELTSDGRDRGIIGEATGVGAEVGQGGQDDTFHTGLLHAMHAPEGVVEEQEEYDEGGMAGALHALPGSSRGQAMLELLRESGKL